jgi:phosphate transport system protein
MAESTRLHYQEELEALEERALGGLDLVVETLNRTLEAVEHSDIELAQHVVADDDRIDGRYLEVHQSILTLLARQAPVATDLRLISALLHLMKSVERMGDQCVNIAKITRSNQGLPSSQRICDLITEMGDLVRPMIRTAIEAFVRKDLDEARLLPAMDEPVDRINANMYREAVEVSGDKAMLEWATKMILVSRALERIGDQSVDFAEQTAYLITGDRLAFDEAGLIRSVNDSTG